jgi:hypothetical protein
VSARAKRASDDDRTQVIGGSGTLTLRAVTSIHLAEAGADR